MLLGKALKMLLPLRVFEPPLLLQLLGGRAEFGDPLPVSALRLIPVETLRHQTRRPVFDVNCSSLRRNGS